MHGERRNASRFLFGKAEGKRETGRFETVDMRIILKWVLKKWDPRMWTGFIWRRIGTNVGSCEYRNEPSGYLKRMDFLD
jgi:hypothetical protein